MKRPRIGERVRTRADTEETIVSFDLYQPAAPRFFQVDTASGRVLFITFRGLGWIEYERAPAEGSNNLPGGIRAQGDPATGVHRAPDKNTRPATNLPAGHGAQGEPATAPEMVHATPRRQPHSHTHNEPDSQGDQGLGCGTAPRTCGSTEIKRSGEFRSRRRKTANIEALARRLPAAREAAVGRMRTAPLRARLDAAREAYSRYRAGEHVDGDQLLALQETYCGLIAELDRVDPGHFGRPRADAPVSFGRCEEELPDAARALEGLTPIEAAERDRKLALQREYQRRYRAAAREGEAQ